MIRFFRKSDIEEINRLGNTITKNFSKTMDFSEIEKDKYTKVLVYEDKDILKGFLIYTELEEIVDIIGIVVKEEYRNQKIASCLLDYMITGLSESVSLITLEVRKSNSAAIHLYEKFGFEVINVRKKYYDGREDAYLMGRRIEQ